MKNKFIQNIIYVLPKEPLGFSIFGLLRGVRNDIALLISPLPGVPKERQSNLKNFVNCTCKIVSAFTLAEVLISLTIVGVIVSMTIPSLAQNMGKQQYVSWIKKAMSTSQQALYGMQADYGNISSVFSGGLDNTGDIFSSFFNVAKNCKITTDQDCIAINNENFDGLAGTNYDWNNIPQRYKFVTTDRMSYTLYSYNTSCAEDKGLNANSPTSKLCAWLFIDVNSKKKPNCYGKDVFSLYITNNKAHLIYPMGGEDDNIGGTGVSEGNSYWNYNNNNRCSATNKYGWYYAARVIEKTG